MNGTNRKVPNCGAFSTPHSHPSWAQIFASGSCFQMVGTTDFKILTGTPGGKRPLGSPRRRWEDNIRMDLKEMWINTRNWVDSVQDRDYWRDLVNAALNLRVPLAIGLVQEHTGQCIRIKPIIKTMM